ncbi:hypothetical protein ACFSBZ_06745 [Amnibacterium flavum]|uniref:hypothetical protein n=1 Tax=Amnibacterium flavum TaxID=2173173 RepID=UPI001402BC7D|nr:hypothetical protein [Amnibacterium flavum]
MAWLRDDWDDWPDPGRRVLAGVLYDAARRGIGELAAAGELIVDDGPPFFVPGPRIFYAAADAVLGARRRSNGVDFYSPGPYSEAAFELGSAFDEVTEPHDLNRQIQTDAIQQEEAMPVPQNQADFSELVFEAVVDKLVSETRGSIASRLLSQRERLASTATEVGARVTPLPVRRAV